MASQYHRLMDPTTLKPNLQQDLQDVFDAGAFRVLEVDVRVLKAGSAGSLLLQHAAVNEEDAYRDLAGSSVSLTGSGAYFTIQNFLRFVRWRADGNVAGDPIPLIDTVAKE